MLCMKEKKMSPIDEIKFKYMKWYTTITVFFFYLPNLPITNPLKCHFLMSLILHFRHSQLHSYFCCSVWMIYFYKWNNIFSNVKRFFWLKSLNFTVMPHPLDIFVLYAPPLQLFLAIGFLVWYDACICVDDQITMVTIGTPIYGNIHWIDTKKKHSIACA